MGVLKRVCPVLPAPLPGHLPPPRACQPSAGSQRGEKCFLVEVLVNQHQNDDVKPVTRVQAKLGHLYAVFLFELMVVIELNLH